MVQLSHQYMTTWKTITFYIQTFVVKVMSLLFNTLSRFVTAFLPRCKHLLISWLWLPSTVILETKKIVCHFFHCFPIYLHEVMGLDSIISVFWMLSFKPAFSLVTFPGGSHSPGPETCCRPYNFATVWELLWYNCSPVYGLPSWQLFCEADDNLLQEDFATCLASQDGCCQSPGPCCGPLLTCASSGDTQPSKAGLAQSLMEVNAPFSGSSCTQGFVCMLRTSLVVMGFDFKSYCIPATVLLWLFLCPWTWGIFFW